MIFRRRMQLGNTAKPSTGKPSTVSTSTNWGSTIASVVTAAASSYAAVQAARQPGLTNGMVYNGYAQGIGYQYDPYAQTAMYGYNQTPSWLLPVGLGVGAVALAFMLRKR